MIPTLTSAENLLLILSPRSTNEKQSRNQKSRFAVWEAISAHSDTFIMGEARILMQECETFSSDRRPMSWTARCAAVIFSTKNSPNKSVWKLLVKPGVPRSTMFDHVPVDEVRSANIWKWTQRHWHEKSRSLCHAVGMDSDSLVSRQISVFRRMCSLP